MFDVQISADTNAIRVNSLSVIPIEDAVKIIIDANGAIDSYKKLTLNHPPRIVLDLMDIKSQFKRVNRIPVDSEWLTQVRYYSHPNKLRIVLDTKNSRPLFLVNNPQPNGLEIYVCKNKASMGSIEKSIDSAQKAIKQDNQSATDDKNRILDNIEILIGTGGTVQSTSPVVNETVQFKAAGHYKVEGQPVDPSLDKDLTTVVSWSSSNTTNGSIGAGTGLFTAIKDGTIHITASLNNLKSNAVAITVQPLPVVLDNIEIFIGAGGTVQSTSPMVNETVQFKAVGHYAVSGQPVDPSLDKDLTTSVSWSSLDTTKGSIGAGTGLFTALSDGSTNVTASLDGTASNQIAMTVQPLPIVLDNIEIFIAAGGTDRSTSPMVNETVQFMAVGHYAVSGQPVDPSLDKDLTASVAWSSSDTTKGSIDAGTGLLTALSDGSTTVTASLDETSSNQIAMTVQPLPIVLDDIEISIGTGGTNQSTSPMVNETVQFMAVGHYAVSGQPVDPSLDKDITEKVNWSSSDTSKGSIGAGTGLFTALSDGSTNVTASLNNVAGNTVTMTVEPLPAAKIRLEASKKTFNTNGSDTVTITCTIEDANGNIVTDYAGADLVFSVSSTNLATFEGEPTATVTVADIKNGVAKASLTSKDTQLSGTVWVSATSGSLNAYDIHASNKSYIELTAVTKIPASPAKIESDKKTDKAERLSIAPTVNITEPTEKDHYITSASSIYLAGSAHSEQGVLTEVTWLRNNGESAPVEGIKNWRVSRIPLMKGENRITVTAATEDGNKGEDTITITNGPVVQITSPTTERQYVTHSAFINLAGNAMLNEGIILQVAWSNSTGIGIAKGTTRWSATNIPLVIGKNRISVSAIDQADNIGSDELIVIYTPRERLK